MESVIGTLGVRQTPLIRNPTIRHIGTQIQNTALRPIGTVIRNFSKLPTRTQNLLKAAYEGRAQHSAWRAIKNIQGDQTEVSIPGGRIDPLRIFQRGSRGIAELKELKPNNAGAIAKGIEHLEQYAQTMSNMAKYSHVADFVGIVETYSMTGLIVTQNLEISYQVQNGDNLTGIAKAFGTTVEQLAELNKFLILIKLGKDKR